MIKKVQKLVGAKQDGEAGGETVEKMQKFLKGKGFYTGKIDKSVGKMTVKAWQKYVNSRLEKKS
jgi:lysozyme family protein